MSSAIVGNNSIDQSTARTSTDRDALARLTFGEVRDVSFELPVHDLGSDAVVRDGSLDARETIGLVCESFQERRASTSRSAENEEHLSRSDRTSERVENGLVLRVTKGGDRFRKSSDAREGSRERRVVSESATFSGDSEVLESDCSTIGRFLRQMTVFRKLDASD